MAVSAPLRNPNANERPNGRPVWIQTDLFRSKNIQSIFALGMHGGVLAQAQTDPPQPQIPSRGERHKRHTRHALHSLWIVRSRGATASLGQ
jgi:hypothetical protein